MVRVLAKDVFKRRGLRFRFGRGRSGSCGGVGSKQGREPVCDEREGIGQGGWGYAIAGGSGENMATGGGGTGAKRRGEGRTGQDSGGGNEGHGEVVG